jgi:formylmethanofuran dehydrogenase subunit D
MTNAKLILIPGRSLKQGTGLNRGKESAEYRQAITTLEMSHEDMTYLGLEDGNKVKIRAPGGEAVAQCKGSTVPEGLAFIAYGPVSSELMGDETHGSGMPSLKGIEVEVERVD